MCVLAVPFVPVVGICKSVYPYTLMAQLLHHLQIGGDLPFGRVDVVTGRTAGQRDNGENVMLLLRIACRGLTVNDINLLELVIVFIV